MMRWLGLCAFVGGTWIVLGVWWRTRSQPVSKRTLQAIAEADARRGYQPDRAPWDWSQPIEWK